VRTPDPIEIPDTNPTPQRNTHTHPMILKIDEIRLYQEGTGERIETPKLGRSARYLICHIAQRSVA
jgi:hypothetical protein